MSSGALMSCVREGSLEPPYRPHHDPNTNGEGRTGRFLRGLRRMFRRRSGARTAPSPDPRSASTSELLEADRHGRRKEGVYGSGLSVSHDSVFTGERSGDESGEERPAHAHTSHRAELVAAVRRRGRGDGSDDDEDLGLPSSPPASPPTDKADKRHHAGISQSSCSDGSLLSVGSSEMDEDSSSGHHHDHSARSDHSDNYNSSEPPTGVAPLSHSAAKHKMAVRPRRKHGAPRRKKNTPITATSLPITPELNEEMIRSTTPEVVHKTTEVVTESFSSTTVTKHQMTVKEQHQLQNRELLRVMDSSSEAKLKSSSLPPGLALSQLVGQSPAKLSLADSNTPRSSIKRSKSSSQHTVTDGPKSHGSSETQIQSYHSEEKVSYLEKKSKSEKKIENEALKSSKKEESFFSRLLLRKSGKKSKKDQVEGESSQEVKKQKTEKKPAEKSQAWQPRPLQKPVLAEKPQKSAGQRAFANQMHKRLDNKGAYVQESAYKDVYSAAKVAGVEYITDLKLAEETDRMLNSDPKIRYSRYEEHTEKIDRTKRSSSKEAVSETRRESFNLHHDRSKRPASVQRLMEPYSTKAFINNEIDNRAQEEVLSPILISDEEPPIRPIKIPNVKTESSFHSGSMPKNLPYFNPSIIVTSNTSPSKSQNSIQYKHKSAEHISEYCDKRSTQHARETIHVISKSEESYSGLRSLGDEYVEGRNSIGKSHSFRYPSEIASQEQMPSLPAIVGISEPLLQSWEVNYRRNVSDRHDYNKRVSARNYNIIGTADSNFDSLPSTDSSYLDSLQADDNDRKLFNNAVHINTDARKRDSDISQIEAKIDDIISSPKPIMASILKSSSLDSVKSSPEKPVEDRRKTISVDSVLSGRVGSMDKEIAKSETENYITVTMINKEQSPVLTISSEPLKINKSDEKLQKSSPKKAGVPEFLNIQLNKIESKPTNVVLTANVTPKKIEPQAEKEQETEIIKLTETKTVQTGKDSFSSNKVTIENVPQPSQNSQPVKQSSPIPKTFFKKKSMSVEAQDRSERPVKSRTNSVSTDGSTEKLDNISIDQKSRSSFGSKSSIQSTDSNEIRTPDRNEETVIYRKKHVISRSDKKNDEEPELMKVFARRSLKLKDSEVENVTHEISEAKKKKEEMNDTISKTKLLKNDFNASIKSRDSDKENDDSSKEQNEDKKQSEEKRTIDIAARVSQFGAHYQRSVSINGVTNNKRDSVTSYKSDIHKYKKEVSDSTPEKRLRNRTFPDSSNDRDDLKGITKSESYKADTLSKRPWQRPHSLEKDKRDSIVIERDVNVEKEESGKERDGAEGEADGSPQFKGILQMRAEWERRAKQGMTN